jgi:hypothetical protein
MPYTVKPIDEGQYMLAEHSGHVTFDELKEGQARTNELLRQRRWRKVFIDTTGMKNDLSTLEIYCMTVSHREVFPIGVALGLLLSQTEERKQGGRFIENIAINRSLNLRVFFDCDQAKAWLTRDEI